MLQGERGGDQGCQISAQVPQLQQNKFNQAETPLLTTFLGGKTKQELEPPCDVLHLS